jgi:2-alkenal reductase
MEHSDRPYYRDELPQRELPRRSRGASRAFVFAIAAIAVLFGFSFGLLASDTLGSDADMPLYDEELVTTVFEKASPAVVEITVSRQNSIVSFSGMGTGSGFLIDREGHILTNNHVIDGAEEIRINLSDGRTITATRLGTSPADDLALLQVDPDEVEGIEPLPLADSDAVRPGQLAVAIGSPFRNFNSVTVGVVSGTGRGPATELKRPIPDMIQTDAPLNPGNSGGPLLNSRGEVIGVNSAVRTPTFQQLNDFRIGFAVPSNTIKALIPQLLVANEVRRPWLGIGSDSSINEQLPQSSSIPPGVVITRVFLGSPAQQAGLIPFRSFTSQADVITAIDGLSVSAVEGIVTYFNSLKPGDTVTLTVFRIDDLGVDENFDLEVTLAEWPDD